MRMAVVALPQPLTVAAIPGVLFVSDALPGGTIARMRLLVEAAQDGEELDGLLDRLNALTGGEPDLPQ